MAGYLERYDRLVDEGLAANPIPERTPGKRGPKAKGKFRCLLERFRDFKDDILRFARDWRVPYTNNTAERAIRCARVKEKVSGCFRTKSGADDFARVLSFTSSAALHGVSSLDAIVAAFRGGCCWSFIWGGQLHIMKKTRFVAGTVCYSHKPSLWRLKVKYIKSMDIAHPCDYNSVRFSLFSIHIMRIEL